MLNIMLPGMGFLLGLTMIDCFPNRCEDSYFFIKSCVCASVGDKPNSTLLADC